jgi:undecaprenyl-diphosphatase
MLSTTTSMTPIEALVLGIVQGLTEFLPISSTAHLRAVPALLHWSDPGVAFSAVIQLGSIIAVLVYFAKDIAQITTGCIASIRQKDYGSTDVRLVAAIVLGTIPICVAGLLLKHVIEAPGSPMRSLVTIGIASIVMGIVLFIAEKVGTRRRVAENIGAGDGLLIGIGQAFALVPGCSRSGSSLTMAMFLGLQREDAARISFLLGIPAIVLSGLLELREMLSMPHVETIMPSLLVGLVSATVVSYVAIWWMLKYLRTHTTLVFIVYRLLFGAVILALALNGTIQ